MFLIHAHKRFVNCNDSRNMCWIRLPVTIFTEVEIIWEATEKQNDWLYQKDVHNYLVDAIIKTNKNENSLIVNYP